MDATAIGFYVRGVAQNVTALSFLGKWGAMRRSRRQLIWHVQAGRPFSTSAAILVSNSLGNDGHPLADADHATEIYPFFRFSIHDPYTFQLTFLATAAVWVSGLTQ